MSIVDFLKWPLDHIGSCITNLDYHSLGYIKNQEGNLTVNRKYLSAEESAIPEYEDCVKICYCLNA